MVEAGYDWQSGSFVMGVEADVGHLGFKGTASSSENDPLITAPDSLASIFTSETGTQTGYIVGASGEYAMANRWSLKAEYLYFDLGTKNLSGLEMNPDVGTPTYGWDVHNRGSIFRVGLNKAF